MKIGLTIDFARSDVHYAVMPGQQAKVVRYRRINRKWRHMSLGIDRDTRLSQQGTTGRLKKAVPASWISKSCVIEKGVRPTCKRSPLRKLRPTRKPRWSTRGTDRSPSPVASEDHWKVNPV
jgi:hypothetical protein